MFEDNGIKHNGLHNYQGSSASHHHRGDIKYGTSRGVQCSCMSLIRHKFDLGCILGKGDQLFKFSSKFRYLGIEDLPEEFLIENSSINMGFLENKTGEITAGANLLSFAEIVYSVQQIGSGALLITNNCTLGLIWENDSNVYLFDSHSKNKNGNLLSSGTAVLLQFDTLYSLENYIQSVYYNAYPLSLCIQVQFIKVQCTINAKSAVKCALKKSECKQSDTEI